MRIRIKDLAVGIHRQNLQEPAGSLGLDEEKLHFAAPIKVRVTLQKVADQIVCGLHVVASLHLECSRCLEPTKATISEDMTLLVEFSATPAQVSADPDVKVVPYGAEEVDVSAGVMSEVSFGARQWFTIVLPVVFKN